MEDDPLFYFFKTRKMYLQQQFPPLALNDVLHYTVIDASHVLLSSHRLGILSPFALAGHGPIAGRPRPPHRRSTAAHARRVMIQMSAKRRKQHVK